jgi:hypothetical protein
VEERPAVRRRDLAAVLRALVDGVRLGRAGERGAAASRGGVGAAAGLLAAVIVLNAFVVSAFHCW